MKKVLQLYLLRRVVPAPNAANAVSTMPVIGKGGHVEDHRIRQFIQRFSLVRVRVLPPEAVMHGNDLPDNRQRRLQGFILACGSDAPRELGCDLVVVNKRVRHILAGAQLFTEHKDVGWSAPTNPQPPLSTQTAPPKCP